MYIRVEDLKIDLVRSWASKYGHGLPNGAKQLISYSGKARHKSWIVATKSNPIYPRPLPCCPARGLYLGSLLGLTAKEV